MARKGGSDRGIYSRTNVDGTLTWYARYSAPVGSGKREFREVAGPSKEAARALYQRRKTEIREGRFDPTALGVKARRKAIAEHVEAAQDRMTLGQAIDHYLPRKLRKRDGTPKSKERVYLETLSADYWKALMGDVLLEDLTPRDLRAWQEERLSEAVRRGGGRKGVAGRAVAGRTVKSSTVNRQLAWLKRILDQSDQRIDVGSTQKHHVRVHRVSVVKEQLRRSRTGVVHPGRHLHCVRTVRDAAEVLRALRSRRARQRHEQDPCQNDDSHPLFLPTIPSRADRTSPSDLPDWSSPSRPPRRPSRLHAPFASASVDEGAGSELRWPG